MEPSNITESFSTHQKELIALFFVIFDAILTGPANFWGSKNLIWKFMREQLDKTWWNWYHWICLINPRRLRLFSKNLVNFDIFCCLCLSTTVTWSECIHNQCLKSLTETGKIDDLGLEFRQHSPPSCRRSMLCGWWTWLNREQIFWMSLLCAPG